MSHTDGIFRQIQREKGHIAVTYNKERDLISRKRLILSSLAGIKALQLMEKGGGKATLSVKLVACW